MREAAGAVLTGVPVAGDLDPLGDRGRIGVVEDDHRRLAAQLEVDALERVGRVRAMILPVSTSPVSETRRTSGCCTIALADRHAVAGDHVQDPGGRISASVASWTKRSVVSGVCSAGFSTCVLPGRERGRELPDSHHQRVVPRRDPADDAQRLAAEHRRVAAPCTRRRPCPRAAGRAGEEAQCCPTMTGHLVARGRQRLADVPRLELGQLLRVLVEQVGELSSAPPARSPGVVSSHSGSAFFAASTARSSVLLRAARGPRRSPRRSPGSAPSIVSPEPNRPARRRR